ncbi:MAG: ATP-binding cassette domain-containing protein [Halioglobus sp.]
MNNDIHIAGLHKYFGTVRALDGINVDIKGGRLTGLVGPDGAGKTTLMRLMAGLMVPTEGSLTVCGNDTVLQADNIHEFCGYMPQRFGLYEDLTVFENLQLYARLRSLPRSEREIIFQRLLEFTGLKPFTRRLAGALSGGMKQKLGLACALIAKPRVLLLDEPSVGVDPVSRQDLWQMVQELVDEGMAVVWSTAYLDEAESCQDVLLLDQGKVVFGGVPQALTSRLEGRSFQLRNIQGNRRQALVQALAMPQVRDGVIQGAAVRLVLAEGSGPEYLRTIADQYSAEVVPVSSRFEDAFIDLLGGGPGGDSAIAARMEVLPTSNEVMVSCHNLSKRFGDFTATDNVSFDVPQGEILGLLGPNGAGKSTTFKMLCGLLKPSAGTATVAGLDLRNSGADAKMQLGYMAQKFSLYGLMTVVQNLNFFAGVYGLSGGSRRNRVEEMVEVFELTPYLNISPDEIPLGFKQRLALACALMHRPRVLFLDEPTSGVDPLTRREFWTHITGLVSKGVTVMVTTHFMDEAEYCDRVALVNRGQLIALDTPDALKASAASIDMPEPTMEAAFIRLVERQNAAQDQASQDGAA